MINGIVTGVLKKRLAGINSGKVEMQILQMKCKLPAARRTHLSDSKIARRSTHGWARKWHYVRLDETNGAAV